MTVFERHLDLTPLRARATGVVACIFCPPGKRASLSVDLARGLFHCFRCEIGGSARRFAELVGDAELPKRGKSLFMLYLALAMRR